VIRGSGYVLQSQTLKSRQFVVNIREVAGIVIIVNTMRLAMSKLILDSFKIFNSRNLSLYWGFFGYDWSFARRNHHEFLSYQFQLGKLTIFLTWHKTYPILGYYQYVLADKSIKWRKIG
jgi:hypothetical protein